MHRQRRHSHRPSVPNDVPPAPHPHIRRQTCAANQSCIPMQATVLLRLLLALRLDYTIDGDVDNPSDETNRCLPIYATEQALTRLVGSMNHRRRRTTRTTRWTNHPSQPARGRMATHGTWTTRGDRWISSDLPRGAFHCLLQCSPANSSAQTKHNESECRGLQVCRPESRRYSIVTSVLVSVATEWSQRPYSSSAVLSPRCGRRNPGCSTFRL